MLRTKILKSNPDFKDDFEIALENIQLVNDSNLHDLSDL